MSILADILGGAATMATGGIGGLVARTIPEVFRLFTVAGDRKHELAMRELDARIAKDGSEQRIRETEAAGAVVVQSKEMDAWVEAIKAQGQKTGIWLADFLNALVRPWAFYYWSTMYGVVKVCTIIVMMGSGSGAAEAIRLAWTADDTAILGGILSFFFVGRAFDRARK